MDKDYIDETPLNFPVSVERVQNGYVLTYKHVLNGCRVGDREVVRTSKQVFEFLDNERSTGKARREMLEALEEYLDIGSSF